LYFKQLFIFDAIYVQGKDKQEPSYKEQTPPSIHAISIVVRVSCDFHRKKEIAMPLGHFAFRSQIQSHENALGLTNRPLAILVVFVGRTGPSYKRTKREPIVQEYIIILRKHRNLFLQTYLAWKCLRLCTSPGHMQSTARPYASHPPLLIIAPQAQGKPQL
jgi:hypothetical protein